MNKVLKEIQEFCIVPQDLENIDGSKTFYKNLFKPPVKLVFYWTEEDYQGSLFVVYQYKDKFIYKDGGFGSCDYCDRYPDTQDEINILFESLNVSDSIQEIEIPFYGHPDFLSDFEKFKNEFLGDR